MTFNGNTLARVLMNVKNGDGRCGDARCELVWKLDEINFICPYLIARVLLNVDCIAGEGKYYG